MSKNSNPVKGYRVKADTSKLDTKKYEDLVFDSTGAFRSTIYSTVLEQLVGKSIQKAKMVKCSGSFLLDLPYSTIQVYLDSKEEGKLKASVTGYTASGLTTAIGFLVIAPALAEAGVSTVPAFAISTLTTLLISKALNDGLDTVWDNTAQLMADLKYDESTGNVEISTPLYDLKEMNNLVAPLMDIQGEKGVPAINNIDIKQTASDGTGLFKLGVEENVYRVAPKDTLYKISKKVGVSEADFLKSNPWLKDRYSRDKSFALIRPDEKLKLPDGKNKEVAVKDILKYINEPAVSSDLQSQKDTSSGNEESVKNGERKKSSSSGKGDGDGHWITTKNGNHIFIEDELPVSQGGFIPFDPKGMAYTDELIKASGKKNKEKETDYGLPEVFYSNVSPEVLEVRNDPEMIAYLSRNGRR